MILVTLGTQDKKFTRLLNYDRITLVIRYGGLYENLFVLEW